MQKKIWLTIIFSIFFLFSFSLYCKTLKQLKLELNSPNQTTRLAALEDAAKLKKNEAKEVLYFALTNNDENVRMRSCLIIGQIKDVGAKDLLFKLAFYDKSHRVSMTAAEALYHLGYKTAIKVIYGYLTSRDLANVMFAASKLEMIGDKSFVKILLQKIEETKDQAIKHRLNKSIQIINGGLDLNKILAAQNEIEKAYKAEQQGNAKKTIALAKKALLLDPTNSDAYWILGSIHSRNPSTQKLAYDELSKAYEYGFTDRGELFFSLGTVLLNLKKNLEALNFLKQATKIKKDPKVYYQLGVSYYQSGHIEKAISATLAATKLDPNYAEAHYNLSLLYNLIQETEKAGLHLKQYNKLKRR